MLLRVLAAGSLILLAYETYTLTFSVLGPLLADRSALQTDFHYYYDAAQRFAQDRARLYLASDDVIAGFAYPPLAILPFLLLSRLPLGAALLVLTIASYAALLLAVKLWLAHLRDRGLTVPTATAAAVFLIAAVSGPAYSNAVFGQVNAFILLAGVAFLRLGANRPAAAGILLACGMWLKIYPALLAWIGAWDRRYRASISYAIAAGVLLLVIALPIVPFSAHRAFVGEVLPARIDQTAIHISNQSVVAFLERFKVPPARFLYWTGEQAVTVSPAVRLTGLAVAMLALFLLWQRARRSSERERVLDEAALLALVSVAVPLGWGHTYVLALPLIALRLVQLPQMTQVQALITFFCVAAFMVPAGRVLPLDVFPAWLQNLAYSRYLLATVLLALPRLR